MDKLKLTVLLSLFLFLVGCVSEESLELRTVEGPVYDMTIKETQDPGTVIMLPMGNNMFVPITQPGDAYRTYYLSVGDMTFEASADTWNSITSGDYLFCKYDQYGNLHELTHIVDK